MVKTETGEELVLIVSEHKQLGYTMMPYIAARDGDTYPQLTLATDATVRSGLYAFSDSEARLVRCLYAASDARLCANFGAKGQTQLTFWSKVSQLVFDNRIVPLVDKQINEALDIAFAIGTPIFYRQAGYKMLYEADRLSVASGKVRPTFFFYLTDKGDLSYTLKINDGQQELPIYGRKVMELTGDPATIVMGQTIYRFANMQSSKFRPFMQKSRILVPASVVPKYMQTYVRQCVMNHYVRASGFRVLKRDEECRPLLRMEGGERGASLSLYFEYGQNTYAYGDSRRTVDVEEENGRYTFYTCMRQSEREKRVCDVLVDEGLSCVADNRFVPEGSEHALEVDLVSWLCVHGEALRRSGIEWQAEANNDYYIGRVDLRVEVSDRIDWFDIEGVVVFDGFEIPFGKFVRNLRDGRREYRLPDGRVFVMPEEWFATWAELAQFATERKGVLSLQKIHAPLLPEGLLGDAELSALPEMNAAPVERRGEVCATLRPYQMEGFRWLAMLGSNDRGGILADDMGLGKTLQVITLLSHVYATGGETSRLAEGEPFATPTNNSGLAPSLIVMPVSLLHNWRNELRRFAPHLRVYVYASADRPRSADLSRILKHYHVVLTSYGIVRNDAHYLMPTTFEYLILDESQYVKNPTSKTYQALMTLEAQHRLTMSGTPIENRLIDLWAQMNIVNPGLLGSANFFRNYFERPIARDPEGERAARLKALTAPYILRRTKEMVATDLPPISEQVVYCPMTDEQRERYDSEKSVVRNQILDVCSQPERVSTEKLQVIQALMRLRLVANHPQLVDASYQGSSGKTEMVMAHIENVTAEGHKLLVFSSFVRDLDMIARLLTEKGIGHAMLTGQTRNREEVIAKFQQSADVNVFLISLKAGGVGLNLTSADYVFVLNPWWNPAAESQAINRAHRIGQTKNVFVYRFLTKDSIEEKIALLQEKKRALANDFVASDNVVSDLTIEELRELA